MKKLIFLLLPLWSLAQDGNFAENDLIFSGNRLHKAEMYDLKITDLNEVEFDIFHATTTQHIFRGYNAGTQYVWLMRVADGTDRATFQLIVDTQHIDSQIELAGTGNTPIILDTDAYVRLGNQSALNAPDLRFYNAGNSYYVAFKAPQTFTGSTTYTWPSTSVNGVLTNNGGVLSWGNPNVADVQPEPDTYTISVFSSFPNSLGPGLTQYFGNMVKPLTTVPGNSKVYFREDCTITGAEISSMSQGMGSAQDWSLYISVNGTTDYLVQTNSVSSQFRTWSNAGLDIEITAGDYIEMKIVNPIWVQVPQNTTFGGYLTVLK